MRKMLLDLFPAPTAPWRRPGRAARCCKKCCRTYFALGRQRCCKKYCWTHSAHFALGGAPGSLRKMLLDLFHSRPRQRCCKKYCWTHSAHFALGGAPLVAAKNVAGPISLSAAPALLQKILLDPFRPFRPRWRPQGRCEKCCWTYFTLGRASAAVKNIVGPIPPISLSAAPQCPLLARNVAEPISPTIAGSAAAKNAVGP